MDSLSFIDFLSSSFYIPFLGFPVCRNQETLLAALPFLLDPQPEPEPLIAGAVSSVSYSFFFVFPLNHSSFPSSTSSVLVLSFSFLCFLSCVIFPPSYSVYVTDAYKLNMLNHLGWVYLGLVQ